MAKWFEQSNVLWTRARVAEILNNLPPPKDKHETAAQFWARVDKAGLLDEALCLYDEIAEQDAERADIRRETKKMFAERIDREGRQDEVEEERKRLSAEGCSLRNS